MSRVRKSKLPAVSAPTSPVELVQSLKSLPQGDSRALAVSSTAIALSIGSAFRGSGDAPSDEATVRRRNTGWQTAYGGARMAVEVAKESSDMFLPLKAVAGALSVLIRNYDVSFSRSRAGHLLTFRFPLQQTLDNADSVKEIEGRVQSLSGVLDSPVSEDDHAEGGRRAELQRFVLERIKKPCLSLPQEA